MCSKILMFLYSLFFYLQKGQVNNDIKHIVLFVTTWCRSTHPQFMKYFKLLQLGIPREEASYVFSFQGKAIGTT